MSPNKRRKKLIRPRIQLKLIMAFLGVSLLALLLQFLLFQSTLSVLAADMPQDGPILLERIPGYTLLVLGISVAILLPMTFFVGVIVTFRVAGPIQRFDMHLQAIARGEDPGTCRIRKNDELQDFCATLNAALDRLKADRVAPALPSAAPPSSSSSPSPKNEHEKAA